MTLRQLAVLHAVAQAGSMSRASKALGVSQPLVTHQIMSLESELHCTLFVRMPRSVALTPAGMAVLRVARRILRDVESIPGVIAQQLERVAGKVVLGVSPISPVAIQVFPELYKTFHDQYPDIDIDVLECPLGLLGEQVRKGAVDLAIMPLPVFSTHLAFETLWSEELVAIFDPVEAQTTDPVRLLDLKDRTFVSMNPDFGIAHSVSTLAQNFGFVPRVVKEATSVSTLIGFVAAGIGVAIMPWPSIQLACRAGIIAARALSPSASRSFALVWRQDMVLSTAAQTVADTLRLMCAAQSLPTAPRFANLEP